MKTHALIVFLSLLLLACTESPEPEDALKPEQDTEELSDEEFLKRHMLSQLGIVATENYSFAIYQEQLDGDDVPDYIATINRLDFALNEAIENGTTVKRAEVGYMGNYNFIAYMNGATRAISSIVPVPSSPHAKLKVSFEKIRSEAYSDVLVDFRIRNSGWRRFFTVVRDQPMQTFEMKLFDGLGSTPTEAYTVRYDKGSYSLARDILVYKAKLEDIEFSDPLAIYTTDPEITPTENLDRRWFFHDAAGKYYTEK